MQEIQRNDSLPKPAEPSTEALAPGSETPAPQADTMPSLEALLKAAELAAQEHHDAWLRAKAEADNIRKRAEAEVVGARKFAIESFAAQLLPVKDSLETTLTVESATVEQLREGVSLTLKLLSQAFEKFSIAEINPVGEKFDPHRHQAMTMVESDGPPNTVMQVMQKGYLLHDRVIRPALVVVSKAKAS